MRSLIGVVLILCSLMLIQAGCAPDAPHDNPLDPQSVSYRGDGNLTGKVLTLGIPYSGISGALVTVEQARSTETNAELTASDGSFSFSHAPSGSLMVVISKPSYMSDTLHIFLSVGGSYNTTVHLDALPQITNQKVVTTAIEQLWPGTVFFATVTANVTDPDGIGDIADSSVHVQIDSASFPMQYSGGTGEFEATIQQDSLPTKNIQWLVGRPFYISARDRENGGARVGPFFVSRIITKQQTPVAGSPPSSPSNDTTTAYPTFEWNPPQDVRFDYSYSLQIFQVNAGTPTQIGSSITIASDSSDYPYPDSLVPGNYFWTIGIIDSYGNSARSLGASFVVP